VKKKMTFQRGRIWGKTLGPKKEVSSMRGRGESEEKVLPEKSRKSTLSIVRALEEKKGMRKALSPKG